MDLAVGARNVYVVMEHVTKQGLPRLVEQCSLPLTGAGCVSRIYTDLATLDVTPKGFAVLELTPGISPDDLQAATATELDFSTLEAAGASAARKV